MGSKGDALQGWDLGSSEVDRPPLDGLGRCVGTPDDLKFGLIGVDLTRESEGYRGVNLP